MKEKNTKKRLKSAGLKTTSARLAVLETFSGKCSPLSAEDIHKKLKKNNIDLVTVYRTVAAFEKAGILRKVDLRKGPQFYELNEHHHHHIVCDKCGVVEELDECNISKFAPKIASKSGKFAMIKDHSLEFFGVCKKCGL